MVILLSTSEVHALCGMGLIYIVCDDLGVIYSAHSSRLGARSEAARICAVNSRPLSYHALGDCVSAYAAPVAA